MGSKRFVPVILFLGLLVAGSYYYLCEIKQVCGDISLTAKIDSTRSDSSAASFQPLSFQFNSAEPIVGNDFQTFREDLLGKIGESDTLLVNGMYYSNEQNGTDLAQERADNVSSLIEDHFDVNRLKTQVNFDGMTTADDQTSLEAVKFTIISSSDASLNTDSTDDNSEDEEYVEQPDETEDSETIEETSEPTYTDNLANHATIYFPKGSVRKNMTPEIRTFIDGLVKLMNEDPNVKVYVQGHSDDENDQGEDHQLGRRRAWVVKKMIWDRGIDPMRIITSSKGESEPRNSNGSDVDRAYNRRVEITIDR